MSAASPSKQKRPPEDIAYDGISFLLTSLRTFYMGTAKAVHSPARRREEQASVPGVPMKAAALNLAALLVGNFQLQPWQQYDEAAEAKAGFAACNVSLPSSSKPGSERVEAATLAIRSRSGHYVRLTEELNQVLFDNRRRYCHLLVLNYFAALGGMKVGVAHTQPEGFGLQAAYAGGSAAVFMAASGHSKRRRSEALSSAESFL